MVGKVKDLFEYQKDWIWIKEYPVYYAGVDFNSRMTVIRLLNNNLLIHSLCEFKAGSCKIIGLSKKNVLKNPEHLKNSHLRIDVQL